MAGGEFIGELGGEESSKFGIGASAGEGGDEGAAGSSGDNTGEAAGRGEEREEDAEVVVGEGGASREAQGGATVVRGEVLEEEPALIEGEGGGRVEEGDTLLDYKPSASSRGTWGGQTHAH